LAPICERNELAEASFRGGARLGWVNATWPFATLKVSRNELRLSSLGSHEFSPSQIVSLEPYGSIPLFSSGIRINHNRPDYPNTIIFWCMGSRAKVLSAIQDVGFSPSGKVGARVPGFPVRWSVLIAVIVLWNMLFLLDGSVLKARGSPPGPFIFVALFGVFALATATRLFSGVQRLVLREGHQIGEVKSFLSLLQLVSGFLSLVFAGMWLGEAYGG